MKIWQIPPRWIDESLKKKSAIDDEEEQEVVPKTDYRTGIEGSIWPSYLSSVPEEEEKR